MGRSKFNGRAGRTDPARRRRIGQWAARKSATEKPDRGAQIDRLATRIGAYAVVAIAGYPVMRLAWLLWEACWRDLPVVWENFGVTIFIMIVAFMIAAVLLFFGFAAYVTALELVAGPPSPLTGILARIDEWRRKQRDKIALGWIAKVAALLRGPITMLAICCLFFAGVMVALHERMSPLFNQSSDDLALTLSVCDQEKLTGHSCQNAMEFCLKNKATNAASCQQYLQELRPTTGRNP